MISLSSGELLEIGRFVEDRMVLPEEIQEGVWRQPTNGFELVTIDKDLKLNQHNLEAVWRLKSPKKLYEIKTRTNKRIVNYKL